MRKLQLEYGAQIGRAVVNFKGPMIFCVISRYHGGAYVVFSRALNEQLEVVALEGTYASVIGGAPAAAVVFASEVEARARKDARLEALTQAMAKAEGKEKARLRAQWNELFKVVHSEKLGEMAEEFDRVHSVHRALRVGALHHILPPASLRPYLIDAVERGMRKTEQAISKEAQTQKPGAKRDQRRGHTPGFSRRAGMMDVYWLEQTEADLPAENDWLSASEVDPPGWYAFCQTPRRLAAGTLDRETCADGLPETCPVIRRPSRTSRYARRHPARRRSLSPTNQRGSPFRSATAPEWPLVPSRSPGRNWAVIWKSSSRVATHSLPTTLRQKSKR